MNILLLGATGQLGQALADKLHSVGEVTALARQQADLAKPATLAATLAAYPADVIVNAAAYTAVDQAETERAAAFAANAESVNVLATLARERQALLLHYSTDYVFDGTKTAPYVETDPVGPLNVYGASKLAGEQAIVASGCDYYILRTSWVYSAVGKNFVRSMLALAQSRDELRIVADQQGSPSCTDHLAEASVQLIRHAQHARAQARFHSEIYHLCGSGQTNWYEFACAIIDGGFQRGLLAKKPALTPITSAEYPQPAKRPSYSLMATSKLDQATGITLPQWRDGLAQVLDQLAAAKGDTPV